MCNEINKQQPAATLCMCIGHAYNKISRYVLYLIVCYSEILLLNVYWLQQKEARGENG